jgi:hypothetical protein
MVADVEYHKERLAAARRAFKKLARYYRDNMTPPDEEHMRELWQYEDELDLESVLRWRDEVGLKRGVLFENGKVEFDEWPRAPHEDLIDLFENMFKLQFVFPWLDPNNQIPPFYGKHNQGNYTLSLETQTNNARY